MGLGLSFPGEVNSLQSSDEAAAADELFSDGLQPGSPQQDLGWLED